ncbi:MAG: hypothetical protein M9894_07865 [Planctomycetes bacterium]|nr:hypothetical protein [Planctomycetota bacterium]
MPSGRGEFPAPLTPAVGAGRRLEYRVQPGRYLVVARPDREGRPTFAATQDEGVYQSPGPAGPTTPDCRIPTGMTRFR